MYTARSQNSWMKSICYKIPLLYFLFLVLCSKYLKAMTRKVNKLFFHRELRELKRSEELLLKKVSELYIGTVRGDGVTGAPVIELEYKLSYVG